MNQTIERLNKNRELADKIIIDEEWIDIRTVRYNATDFTIECNGHKEPIKPNDTEETLREKIEKLAQQRIDDHKRYFALSQTERIEKYIAGKKWNDWSE